MDLPVFSDVVDHLTGSESDPPEWLVLSSAVLALVAVAHGPAWRVTRGLVTIAHEGGHAFAALVTGRKLQGIRLHSDTSGVTLSKGKPTGPGMILTAASGYATPPLLGLLGAAMIAVGQARLLLWMCVALLAAMLVMIRSAFGIFLVLATGGTLFVISWVAPGGVQGAVACLFAWFLLLAGARPVVELQHSRIRQHMPHSDADQLARITKLPGLFWVAVFFIVALGSLVLGALFLLPEVLDALPV